MDQSYNGAERPVPTVSVIVPVFNTAPFLPELLESILSQTYTDLELLCFDDGSTDGSADILREFAERDSRVRVFFPEHGGVSRARNLGIEAAAGRYILFADADDIAEPALLETCVPIAEASGADLVFFDSDMISEDGSPYELPYSPLRKHLFPASLPFSPADIADDLFMASSPQVMNKLIRASFLRAHELRFPMYSYGEDAYFSFLAISLAEKITWTDHVFYHYRQRKSGNLSSKMRRSRLDVIYSFEALRDELVRRGLYRTYRVSFIKRCLAAMGYELGKIGRDPLRFDFYREFRTERFQSLELLSLPPEAYDYPQTVRIMKEALLPVISVIIPVYRSETFLRKCVSSVLSQTYRQLEVILADDGSPDGCPQICDIRALKDKRVSVIHLEHVGRSAAINAALDACHGDLIAFVDSDDWIEPEMLERLADALERADADVAACGYDVVTDHGTAAVSGDESAGGTGADDTDGSAGDADPDDTDGSAGDLAGDSLPENDIAGDGVPENDISADGVPEDAPAGGAAAADPLPLQVFDTREALEELVTGTLFSEHMWDKLYRASLFSGVRFTGGTDWEAAVQARLFLKSRRAAAVPYTGYHYYTNPCGLHRIAGPALILPRLAALGDRFRTLVPELPDLEEALRDSLYAEFLRLLKPFAKCGEEELAPFLPEWEASGAASFPGEFRGKLTPGHEDDFALLESFSRDPAAFRRTAHAVQLLFQADIDRLGEQLEERRGDIAWFRERLDSKTEALEKTTGELEKARDDRNRFWAERNEARTERNEARAELKKTQDTLKKTGDTLRDTERRLSELENSRSYRIGRAVTWVPRKLSGDGK